MVADRLVLSVHPGVVGVKPLLDFVSLLGLGSGEPVKDVPLMLPAVAENVEEGREHPAKWPLRPKDVDHGPTKKTDREEDICAHSWRVARSRIRVNNRLDVTGWQVEEG